ncbi:DUF58 domain-containing protein [Halosolutus gelatinilyticus]|uniref:DUF58 domain-containing protein n=1 Tax=Halosolutus gelatinilyticus TaxID=2931975 RepID=UPI001FF52842|nr:DUF58 domain-containing protein [Halosolutus gelatinilyticus]
MRPTRRGWGVVAVVGFALAMSFRYGPRSLNAVVTPLLVVVLAGVVTAVRARRPTVTRTPSLEGFVGERLTVTATIETNRAVPATVQDAVGDGLSAIDPSEATTLGGTREFSYGIELEERGDHRVGPLSITVTDLFGLFERRFTYEECTDVLVYPPVYDLRGSDGDFAVLAEIADRIDREEFDHLREYRRGDALRDVHWKSAAKRPDDDLVVTEYASDESAGSAVVAAECTPDRTDELAAAVASVATALLELGVDVGLDLPAESRPPGSGQDHHYDLLRSLAVVDAGELEDERRDGAAVLVQADVDGTRVVVDGRTVAFDRLRGRAGATDGVGAHDSRSNRPRTADGTGDRSRGVNA